jgi:hypothetical protein
MQTPTAWLTEPAHPDERGGCEENGEGNRGETGAFAWSKRPSATALLSPMSPVPICRLNL